MDKQIGCTQISDRDCKKEDCCMIERRVTETFTHNSEKIFINSVKFDWSISCEK